MLLEQKKVFKKYKKNLRTKKNLRVKVQLSAFYLSDYRNRNNTWWQLRDEMYGSFLINTLIRRMCEKGRFRKFNNTFYKTLKVFKVLGFFYKPISFIFKIFAKYKPIFQLIHIMRGKKHVYIPRQLSYIKCLRILFLWINKALNERYERKVSLRLLGEFIDVAFWDNNKIAETYNHYLQLAGANRAYIGYKWKRK